MTSAPQHPALPCPSCRYELADAPIINGSKLCPECGKTWPVAALGRSNRVYSLGTILSFMCLPPLAFGVFLIGIVALAKVAGNSSMGNGPLKLLLFVLGVLGLISIIGAPLCGATAARRSPSQTLWLYLAGIAINVAYLGIAYVVLMKFLGF